MSMSNFDNVFFKTNREKLFNEILPESVVVLFSAEQFPKNGDQFFKYRQNSDTYYFSGLTQEDSRILLYKGKNTQNFEEFAFIIEPNQKMITWIGHKYSKNETISISGIKTIEFNDKFDKIFKILIKKAKHLYFSHKSNVRGIKYEHNTFKYWLNSVNKQIQHVNFQDLDKHSMKLRLQKTSKEIKVTQKAIDITGETFHDLLKYLKPGVFEYQVEAEIMRGFISRGAQDSAYP
jgi:Xaa-Pro aminopeptidase